MPWSGALRAPATQHEAWASIFAFLAVVCVALSLTGIFIRPMLLFVIPALVLGVWCLRQRHAHLEFRWLAAGACGIGSFWFVFWLALFLTGHH